MAVCASSCDPITAVGIYKFCRAAVILSAFVRRSNLSPAESATRHPQQTEYNLR